MHPNKDCGMSLTNVGQTLRGVCSTHVSTFLRPNRAFIIIYTVRPRICTACCQVCPTLHNLCSVDMRLRWPPSQYESDDDWHRLTNGKPMGTRLDVMHAAPWHRNTATPRHRLRIDVPDVIRISASGRMIAAHATIASAPGQASWPSLS